MYKNACDGKLFIVHIFILIFSLDNVFDNQNISTNSCLLAGQQFQAGSSWHPYLPPNGFDTCTLCHCNVSNLKNMFKKINFNIFIHLNIV